MAIKALKIVKEKFDNTKEKFIVKTEKELTDFSDYFYDSYDKTVDFIKTGVKKKKK